MVKPGMPYLDIISLVKNRFISNRSNYLVAYMERVWARPSNATRAAFTFGMNYGAWLGILSCSYIDPIIMLPKEWQSMLKRYKIPKDYMERKRKFKVIAQKYVEFNVTLATADAILIANYLKQKGR